MLEMITAILGALASALDALTAGDDATAYDLLGKLQLKISDARAAIDQQRTADEAEQDAARPTQQ